MNKSIQPCDAGIKKRLTVGGQASFKNNNYTNKSTPFSLNDKQFRALLIETIFWAIVLIACIVLLVEVIHA